MKSFDQMQASIILGRRRSPGSSNFEVGSKMDGLRGRQTGGGRESVRLWETGQMLILRRKPVERGEPSGATADEWV